MQYNRFIALSSYKSLLIALTALFLVFYFIPQQKQDKNKNNNNMKTQDNNAIVALLYIMKYWCREIFMF